MSESTAILEPPVIDQEPPKFQSEGQDQAKIVRRYNLPLAAALVAGGATMAEAAEKTGYKNANSMQACLAVKGVTKKSVQGQVDGQAVSKVTVDKLVFTIANQAGELLRDKYARELDRRADDILTVPRTKNLDKLAKAGQVLESQVRAAKIVHGWSESAGQPTVTIDLPESAVEQVDCGLDTPTGSGSQGQIIDVTPQDK